MIHDPSDSIVGQYSHDPVAFIYPPPGLLIGPLKALFTVAGQGVLDYVNEVAETRGQLTVQTATGPYLDAHGYGYGVPRYPSEIDGLYRARIVAAINAEYGTIPAITDALQNYYNLAYPIGTPMVVVYDKASSPAQWALDNTNRVSLGLSGLTHNEFIVQVTFFFPSENEWFLDDAYNLSINTFLGIRSGDSWVDIEGGAIQVVELTRAAGNYPIYKLTNAVE